MWRSGPESGARPATALCGMLLAGVVGGCAANVSTEGENQPFLTNNLPLRLPVRSLQDRRYDGVVRQQYDFSCGSAALATLLTHHYADPQTEQSVFEAMWRDGDREQIRRLGFSLLDMKRYLAARGIPADGYRVSLADIERAALPGIALIDLEGYKHFVTVKGIDGGDVLMGDPALGVRRLSHREFQRIWNGVVFVINSADGQPAPVFNGQADRDRMPRGLGAWPSEPLDRQALSLLRPLPGDI